MSCLFADMKENNVLIFFVNGKKIEDSNVDPEWTLLYYLRNKRILLNADSDQDVLDSRCRKQGYSLCGTKLGCGEGGCGACTVMVSHYDHEKKKVIHRSVNACLAPVAAMHGMAVTTVEGIGSTKTRLHAVQKRIAESHGSQCGFCTPGIVMSMYTLLRNKSKPSFKDMDTALQGNLCRCTGYRPIIEGFQVFTEEWERNQVQYYGNANGEMTIENGCAMGKDCCKYKSDSLTVEEEDGNLFDKKNFVPYDPSQEPIFPPELKISTELNEQLLVIRGKRTTWYRPVSLNQLLQLRSKYTDVMSRIVVGNTEIGIETKSKRTYFPVLIHPCQVNDLCSVTRCESDIRVGSSVTLTDLKRILEEEMSSVPTYKTRIFKEIVEMLHWFAGSQIRNTASVGGNLMTSSPISDLNQIYLAAGVEIEVQSQDNGVRTIKIDENFFTGYRKNSVKADEVLIAIKLPYTNKNQYFHAYKQARRRDDDIAIVNIAVNVEFESGTDVIKHIAIAFGGMAATTVLATSVPTKVVRMQWNEETLEEIYSCLIKDLPLAAGAPGGMEQYRSSLSLSLFFKAYLAVCEELGLQLQETNKIASLIFHSLPLKSSQYCHIAKNGQNKVDPVGRPNVHQSAYKHATGEAVYCDDMPHYENELYLALVLSSEAHAYIKSVDATSALSTEGVVAFFCAKDLDIEQNKYGFMDDEEVFASKEVTTHGQIIGAVVAESQTIAQEAAKLVSVTYEKLNDAILTLEDALQKKSFFPGSYHKLERGNVHEAFSRCSYISSGKVRTGGQEHFYMEPHTTIAIPKGEDGEMEIISSTQNPTYSQTTAAKMLGVQSNKIVCRVKRIGGGFGGKETQAVFITLPVAFAASKLGRPVRCTLDRDEDMMITGTRHPFLGQYKVAFTDEGKVLGAEIKLYSNGGHTLDVSSGVLEACLLRCVNAYHIPNIKVEGWVCKTNIPSNTACRASGAPQGMLLTEYMIRDVANTLKKDYTEVVELNLIKDGDKTHFGQEMENCTVQRCWDECLHKSNYVERKAKIQEFNRSNKWKKRGLSIVPVMFGISFGVKHLDQGGALVLVYEDGSVLLTHGGTEMGQGLHTKTIQVASRVLEIPHSYIHVSETSTDKVPNSSSTSASIGSDVYGMAVLRACETIMERLHPYKMANPKGKWEDWVHEAYLNRVSLSATGFYKTPASGYDWDKNEGHPFSYFTFGVGCSEVQIDCLTGDHQVLRTDIVMDVGESLNPAIDVGQIEGAFMQGYGFYTLEENLFSPQGELLTRGSGTYKIPGFGDIPVEFNVSLLRGSGNPRAVYSSKAVGEPPLFLSSSVFFAIRDAISSARVDNGKDEWFQLDVPATSEKIRIAIGDDITEKFQSAPPDTYIPFSVKV